MSVSLTHQLYNAKQLQQNEAAVAHRAGFDMFQLMTQAGEAAFSVLQQQFPDDKQLLIVCGKGNNGGDGYVIARLAHQHGLNVRVIVTAAQNAIRGEALIALKYLLTVGAEPIFYNDIVLAAADIATFEGQLIVDCLFGIGFKRCLSADMKRLIKQINDHRGHRLAVDIPSGLCADSGAVVDIAVQADATVTFIVFKQGLLTGQAANYVGNLILAPLSIGNSFELQVTTTIYRQNEDNIPALMSRAPASHKGTIGLLLAIGGNEQYGGAIRLCAEAALRSGASLVAACCHTAVVNTITATRPELMLAATDANTLSQSQLVNKVKAIVLGPGLGQNSWASALFNLALTLPANKVVDADGLQLLSQTPQYNEQWILTPHPGEAAKLLACSVAEIEQNRFWAVNAIVQKYGGVCVLKGAGTLISDGQQTWVNCSGNAGMASGGMGDVLAGTIGALTLQMPSLMTAARLGVYIHGRAADIIAQRDGQIGLLASDLYPQIRRLLSDN